jgi:predicted phage terminase large subunit-like protein
MSILKDLPLSKQGPILDQPATTATAYAVGSFADFIHRTAPHIQFYRHVSVLTDRLQQVADGTLKRLIIQMPPRHGKSQLASRLFPAYFLRRHPAQWVGLASYGAELAEGFSRESRAHYTTDGGILDASSRATNLWQTHARGGMWAAGVGGAATGKGYSLGIVDDPVKDAQEADSPTYRQRAKDWWDSVFSTRAEPDAAIVVIQTRWHLDDLTGFLLEKEAATDMPEAWHVVDLAAEASDPAGMLELPPSCTREPDWRAPGEPLCPERFPTAKLQQIRANTAPRWWQALYQQRPTLDDGSVFIREWFRYYDEPPRDAIRLLCSVDATFKEASTSDFVAATIWAQSPDGMFLLDCLNRRMGFTATVAAIEGLWQQYRFAELVIEDAANGPAVIDTLKRRSAGFSIRAVRPLGGKAARANAAAPQFEQGRVLFPKAAPWLRTLEDQLLGFPSATHDDIVDSVTQVLNYVAGTGPMRISTASYGYATREHEPTWKPILPDERGPMRRQAEARKRRPAIPGFR